MAILRLGGGRKPTYEPREREAFTLRIYYGGGIFLRNGTWHYEGELDEFMLELGYAKDAEKEYYYRPNSNGNLAEFERITSDKAVLTMSRILDGSRVVTLYVVVSTPFMGVDFSQCKDVIETRLVEGEFLSFNIDDYEFTFEGLGLKDEQTKVPMSEFEIEMGFHDVPIEQEGRRFSNGELGAETEVMEDDLIDSGYEQSDDEIQHEKKKAPTASAAAASKPIPAATKATENGKGKEKAIY
ncbi:hypothetical protein TorRG33x02_242760 [Trema orientale]|uniref:Uncharacterized protein n=1 Tax=Trema orientale TaxID=63057 RepID=A0A2P5DSS7_TREOI|nr:hypothetical protein TorRG33x02_242760 [Trema orientale]